MKTIIAAVEGKRYEWTYRDVVCSSGGDRLPATGEDGRIPGDACNCGGTMLPVIVAVVPLPEAQS